jgi:ABC-2 type transport system ATP-binding protein
VAAVQIHRVSKRFRVYNEKFTSLKERLTHLGRVPYEELWALRDIQIEVEQGETLGLLGHNGSGKSTLLKCLAGILQPTQGEIRTVGRVAALLELGAGFNPELSGRENVFLNASLLGISSKEIGRKFDDIVGFAELERSIDQQVKYYSSGMYVRLGFAVAVNMDPDILLVDEVLAVGDEMFQRKCLDRVNELQREGRTIIFVTHAADLVRQICNRAVVLDEGVMVAYGPPGEAIRTFREHLLVRQQHRGEYRPALAAEGNTEVGAILRAAAAEHPGPVWITNVHLDFPDSADPRFLLPAQSLLVRVEYEASAPVDDLVATLSVHDSGGALLFTSRSDWAGRIAQPVIGRAAFSFTFPSVPLLDGTYPITVGLQSRDGGTVYDWRDQQVGFEVMNPGSIVGALLVPATIEWRQLEPPRRAAG